MQRRTFLSELTVAAAALASPAAAAYTGGAKTRVRYLRPPGALPEPEFLTRGGRRSRLAAIMMFEMRVGYAKI